MTDKFNTKNIKPFDGSKYSVWKYRVFLVLDEQNVLNVMNDKRPEEPNNRWLTAEKTAKRILVENIEDSMLPFFKREDTAKEAGNEIDRRSTTGFLFKIFGFNTISWNTKRQNSVATSSTEAEYMALFESVKEACWLKKLLRDIKIDIIKPIKIFEDKNACIAIANNPTDHKRSKHIDVKYHFCREKVEANEIILEYINTGEQLADVFTKSLPATLFLKIRAGIGME